MDSRTRSWALRAAPGTVIPPPLAPVIARCVASVETGPFRSKRLCPTATTSSSRRGQQRGRLLWGAGTGVPSSKQPIFRRDTIFGTPQASTTSSCAHPLPSPSANLKPMPAFPFGSSANAAFEIALRDALYHDVLGERPVGLPELVVRVMRRARFAGGTDSEPHSQIGSTPTILATHASRISARLRRRRPAGGRRPLLPARGLLRFLRLPRCPRRAWRWILLRSLR